MKLLPLTYRNMLIVLVSMIVGMLSASVALHAHRVARERMFERLPVTQLEPIVIVAHRTLVAHAADSSTSAR